MVHLWRIDERCLSWHLGIHWNALVEVHWSLVIAYKRIQRFILRMHTKENCYDLWEVVKSRACCPRLVDYSLHYDDAKGWSLNDQP